MRQNLFLWVFYLGSFPTFAQLAVDKEPLITDRPGEGTDAAFVVDPGAIQLEMGFLFQNDDRSDQKLIRYPTALLRIGLIERVELRASADLFEEGQNSPILISPLVLGTKVHLMDNQGWIPQAALMVNVTLPDIGSEEVRSEFTRPQIKLMMNHTLTQTFGITSNLGIAWDNDLALPVHTYAASLDISLTDYLGAFTEFYGFWSRLEGTHLFNAGSTILLLPDFQIDLAGGVGLSENAPDFYVGGGVSVRF